MKQLTSETAFEILIGTLAIATLILALVMLLLMSWQYFFVPISDPIATAYQLRQLRQLRYDGDSTASQRAIVVVCRAIEEDRLPGYRGYIVFAIGADLLVWQDLERQEPQLAQSVKQLALKGAQETLNSPMIWTNKKSWRSGAFYRIIQPVSRGVFSWEELGIDHKKFQTLFDSV
jgi:hypothetical protein